MNAEVRLYKAVTDARRAHRAGEPLGTAVRLASARYHVPIADLELVVALAESACEISRQKLDSAGPLLPRYSKNVGTRGHVKS